MFKIIGRYRSDKFEVIDSADNEAEAYRLLGEYQIAFGNEWILRVLLQK